MSLVERHTLAAEKPVDQLELGEMRLLVTQYRAGGPSEPVLRRVLDVLADNPLMDICNYPGDLLEAVLNLPGEFWAGHQDEWQEVHHILKKLDGALTSIESARMKFTEMT